MKTDLIKFNLGKILNKKILEEIIHNFDKTHCPINTNEFTKPSELSYKTPELIVIAGISPSKETTPELIRYNPEKTNYLEIKGNQLIIEIETILKKYKIKYNLEN